MATYIITSKDVGQRVKKLNCDECGQVKDTINFEEVLGRVTAKDIGKMVRKFAKDYWQVENDEQFLARKRLNRK